MDWQDLKYYRWWILGVLLGTVCFIAVFLFCNRPIKTVKIVGRFNSLTPQCVYNVLGPHLEGRYWPTHQNKLLTTAKSECPWVYNWQWHYHWPHTLVIHIAENHPQVIFNQQSLVNQADELFTPKKLPKTLPAISFIGPPDGFVAMLNFYKQAVPLLQAQNLSIIQLKLDPANGYQIILNNHIVLKVDEKSALQTLSRFISVDQNIFGQRHKPIQAIDLRYPHGFAVQWKTKK